MSYQDLLNRAVAGILAQGCQSYVDNGSEEYCAYRGPNNTKCAIGHLLTDEQMREYDIKENQIPTEFPDKLIEELAPNKDRDEVVQFFTALQRAHDYPDNDIDFIENFKGRIDNLVKKKNLINPCP